MAYIIQKQATEFLKEEGRNVLRQQCRKKWSRPESGFLKINTDGSFSPSTGSGGWGFVIRDGDAMITHAGAGSYQNLLNAVLAAADQGMTRVVLETDSQLVKSALESNMFALADTGGIVYELKFLISSSFSEFKVLFSPRTCNSVAHAVAALGCMCPRDTLLWWEGCTPDGLEDLVASDITESMS